MSASTTALSRTLKTITLTKINELEKQRNTYARRKDTALDACSVISNQRERIKLLLEAIEDLKLNSSVGINLSNIRRWLEQSQFDASIPTVMLSEWEAQLRSQLDVQTRRLDLAALYSRLLTEWLTPTQSGNQPVDAEEEGSLDGPFEVVQKDRLKQLKDKFEAVVFTPLDTDEIEIDNYLADLFSGDDGDKALENLRNDVKNLSIYTLGYAEPFDEHSITWCLKGLLGNELLRDDKKNILQEFLNDEVARGEICDVLNMKFKDIKNWEWDSGREVSG